MTRRNDRWRTIFICLAIAAATVVSYLPVLHNDFVSYDDFDYVVENPQVLHGLTWDSAAWAFTHGYSGNWHPLTWMSHALDVQLFGLHAGGHHAVSLAFHTFNSVLLFLLLRRMTGAIWRSAFAAALFALHPAHVESVAWVAERKDVLSAFFFFLTLWAYTSYVQSKDGAGAAKGAGKPRGAWLARSTGWYVLALLLFACGLMSKPMLVTLPFVLLLLDLWPFRRFEHATVGRLVMEKAPFFALAAASCVVTFHIQQHFGAVTALDASPPGFRISNALISLVRYLGMMLWPTKLAVFYPAPKEWPGLLVPAALLLLVALSALVLWAPGARPTANQKSKAAAPKPSSLRARHASFSATGWFFFVGTLIPVIGLIQVGRQSMADRYTYIPFVGLFLIAAWGIARVTVRWPAARHAVVAGAIAVLAACGLMTARQATYWRDSRSLYEHALEVTHDNFLAHNNLGVLLLNAGEVARARQHFEEAVRIDPRYAPALQNLGACSSRQGNTEEAISYFQRAIKIKPMLESYINLGELYLNQGKYGEADAQFEAALQVRPESAEAMFDLARSRQLQGNVAAARQAYLNVLKVWPDFSRAHLGLGLIYMDESKFDEAIAEFQAAAPMLATNAAAQLAYAFALSSKGRFAEAQRYYTECCRLQPGNMDAQKGLGLGFFYQGKFAEAVAPLELVARIRPDARVQYLLAIALHTQGQFDLALPHYREAVRLEPGNPNYLNDLAWILATYPQPEIRDGPEAVRLAETACKLSEGKEARFFGSLDAAYAEVGRFEDALATVAKTRELALAAGQKEIAQAADERAALYRAKKPYHQPALGEK